MTSYVAPAVMRMHGFGYHADNPAAGLPMPPAEIMAPSRQGNCYYDVDFEAVLRGLRSIRLPASCLVSEPLDAPDATPTTPKAELPAPPSYGGDAAAAGDAVIIKASSPKPKKQPQQFEYDASIDAALRTMEKDPAERSSADYLRDTQAGDMMMADRAELIAKMHHFFMYYDLAPGTLHRAVSYVDRFLSARKINSDDHHQISLLAAAAVFAAAKYEDRITSQNIDADSVAEYAGCTWRQAVEAELELVAALGYRLSGPTAYVFIDLFMRNSMEDEGAAVVRSLAHHLADMALLDYRCVAFLPSAVAASAIYLARLATLGLGYSTAPVAGYTLEHLSDCMEAIYDMHDNMSVWPGCAQMMTDWVLTSQRPYSLPPPPYSR